MLEASGETRKRIRLIALVVSLLLGASLIYSFWERLRPEQNGFVARRPDESGAVPNIRVNRVLAGSLCELGRRGAFEDVVRLTDPLVNIRGRDASTLAQISLIRAEALAALGRWEESAEQFRAVAPVGFPAQNRDAGLFALAESRDEYRAVCAKLLAPVRAKADADSASLNLAVWNAVLLPDTIDDWDAVVPLAERAAKLAPPFEKANVLNTLGAAQCRAGRYAEAVATLKRTEAMQSTPFNWAFLSLAELGRGDRAAASVWAKRLREQLDSSFGSSAPGDNRHELLIFRREIDRKLGAVRRRLAPLPTPPPVPPSMFPGPPHPPAIPNAALRMRSSPDGPVPAFGDAIPERGASAPGAPVNAWTEPDGTPVTVRPGPPGSARRTELPGANQISPAGSASGPMSSGY